MWPRAAAIISAVRASCNTMLKDVKSKIQVAICHAGLCSFIWFRAMCQQSLDQKIPEGQIKLLPTILVVNLHQAQTSPPLRRQEILSLQLRGVACAHLQLETLPRQVLPFRTKCHALWPLRHYLSSASDASKDLQGDESSDFVRCRLPVDTACQQ